jgi:hypothetical protein
VNREYDEFFGESSEVYDVSDDMDVKIADANSGRFLDIPQSSLIKARGDARKFLDEIDLTHDIALPTLTTTSYVLCQLLM